MVIFYVIESFKILVLSIIIYIKWITELCPWYLCIFWKYFVMNGDETHYVNYKNNN